jgi:hypothetical protein
MTESVYASKGLEDYSRMKRYSDYLDYDRASLFREKGKGEAGLRNIGNSTAPPTQPATSTSSSSSSSTSTTSGRRSLPPRSNPSTPLPIQIGATGARAVRRDGDRASGLRGPVRLVLAAAGGESVGVRGRGAERLPRDLHAADRPAQRGVPGVLARGGTLHQQAALRTHGHSH